MNQEKELNKPKRIPLALYYSASSDMITLLNAFGYTELFTPNDNNVTITCKHDGLWCYLNGNATFHIPNLTKCTDELLFVALASLNEENDLYQIFIKDVPVNIPRIGLHIPAGSPVISLTKNYQDFDNSESGFHKATKDELVELITKNQQTRQLIHNFFYHTVLDDYNKKKDCNDFDPEPQIEHKENFKEKFEALLKEHNQLKETITKLLANVKDMVVVNKSIGDILHLFIEDPYSLTKEEKTQIVQRFANVKTVEESNNLYRSIKKEMNERHTTTSSDDKQTTKPRPRVYISLPITDREEEARKECKETKEWLEKRFPEAEFISPFEVTTEREMPYSYYMGRDVEALLECESVIFLDGWKVSKGCRSEHYLAEIYDKKIIYIEDIREALKILP